MTTPTGLRLSPRKRRAALRWGLVNGALWAGGNALTTGPLLFYLARDLGASGRAVSLLLATANLAGLLRLLTPAVIAWLGTAKRAAIVAFGLSYCLLLGQPLCAALPAELPRQRVLAWLIALVCTHQLLEFIGSVALWAWLGDLVPARIRGRYFGRRQMWQLAVAIPALIASGYFADWWRGQHLAGGRVLLWAYALPTALGTALLLASVVPLVLMPATPGDARKPSLPWRSIVRPFLDARFRRLLAFRCAFSFSNGITQTVQSIYPKDVLKFGVGDLALMRVVMQVGQLLGSPVAGRWADRVGNRPVLLFCQVFTTASMAFYLAASPEHRWLLLGAWVMFAFYAGHNVCLPNLTLRLAPPRERAAYVAAPEALASIFHAAATLLGGELYDRLGLWLPSQALGAPSRFVVLFGLGLLLRAGALVALIRVEEPRR